MLKTSTRIAIKKKQSIGPNNNDIVRYRLPPKNVARSKFRSLLRFLLAMLSNNMASGTSSMSLKYPSSLTTDSILGALTFAKLTVL